MKWYVVGDGRWFMADWSRPGNPPPGAADGTGWTEDAENAWVFATAEEAMAEAVGWNLLPPPRGFGCPKKCGVWDEDAAIELVLGR